MEKPLVSFWGALKMRDWKMRDWKYRHQTAGLENAGLLCWQKTVIWHRPYCVQLMRNRAMAETSTGKTMHTYFVVKVQLNVTQLIPTQSMSMTCPDRARPSNNIMVDTLFAENAFVESNLLHVYKIIIIK